MEEAKAQRETRPWWSISTFETFFVSAIVIVVCWYIASWPDGLVEWFLLPVAIFFGRSFGVLCFLGIEKIVKKVKR